MTLSAADSQLDGNVVSVLNELLYRGGPQLGNGFFLGEILEVDESIIDQPGVLDARITLSALIEGAVMAANRSSALSVKDLEIDMEPLLTVDLDLEIIEPPVVRFGPAGCADGEVPPCVNGWQTEVQSAQLKLGLTAHANVASLATLKFELATSAVESTSGIAALHSLGGGVYVVQPEGRSVPATVHTGIELDLLPIAIPLLTGERSLNSLVNVSLTNPQRTDSWQGAHVSLPQVQWPCSESDCESSGAARLAAVSSSVEGLLNGLKINLSSSFGLLNLVLRLLSDVLNIAVSSLGNMTDLLTTGVGGVLTPLAGEVDQLLADLGIATNTIEVTIHEVAPGTPNLTD